MCATVKVGWLPSIYMPRLSFHFRDAQPKREAQLPVSEQGWNFIHFWLWWCLSFHLLKLSLHDFGKNLSIQFSHHIWNESVPLRPWTEWNFACRGDLTSPARIFILRTLARMPTRETADDRHKRSEVVLYPCPHAVQADGTQQQCTLQDCSYWAMLLANADKTWI